MSVARTRAGAGSRGTLQRSGGRGPEDLRPVTITTGYLKHPAGSAMIDIGDTRVLCTASIEERVPPFLHGNGEGWVTGEYAMIPAATDSRSQREVTRGRQSGRTLEIQRLIGRTLRSVVDRKALGERTVWIDCEVLQADGGTRTAAVTGGFVALALALHKLHTDRAVKKPPLVSMLSAISVGIVRGTPMLDLDYAEDSAAEVDMNVVRCGDGRYVEVQGTAEKAPFARDHLDALLTLADRGTELLHAIQREALGAALEPLLAR